LSSQTQSVKVPPVSIAARKGSLFLSSGPVLKPGRPSECKATRSRTRDRPTACRAHDEVSRIRVFAWLSASLICILYLGIP
jgi:hypothetical protein